MVVDKECPDAADLVELISKERLTSKAKALISCLYLAVANSCEITRWHGQPGITVSQVRDLTFQVKDKPAQRLLMLAGIRTRRRGLSRGYSSLRDVPVDIVKDKPFVDALTSYANKLFKGKNPELFPFSQTTAWRICNDADSRLCPRLLKVARCKELAARNYDDKELKYIAGFTRSSTAKKYTDNVVRYGRANANIIIAHHFKTEVS